MGGKKSAAMFPEPGPDLFFVRLRDFQSGERLARKEFKSTFTVYGGSFGKPGFDLEQKHQPMSLAPVTMLADQAGEMQITWTQFNA